MNCIIVDDEPLAREAIEILVKDTSQLNLTGMFNNAIGASKFMEENPVDLIFLDIQMPGITGIEFAHNYPRERWSFSPRLTRNMLWIVTRSTLSTI